MNAPTTQTSDPATHFFRASAKDFEKIPGSPLAYWLEERFLKIFQEAQLLKVSAEVKHGLSTGKNEEVVRLWLEVNSNDFGPRFPSREEALRSDKKWFPYNKGGDYRKWYGNCEYVLRYDDFGNRLMSTFSGHRHDGKSHYFLEGVTWTFISSSKFAARYTPSGFVFDVSGSSLFVEYPFLITGFLCSNLCYEILKALNPTLNFQVGNLKSLPILEDRLKAYGKGLTALATSCIELSRLDWDAYETSWDFTSLPLLSPDHRAATLEESYSRLRTHWQSMTDEMQRLEEENNRIFIEAYGLQDELTPEVPIEEITLTCNPAYRYGGKASTKEKETRLRADTMREFLSYAVGCMMGRFSLEKPGLILANAGDTLDDYVDRVGSGRCGVGSEHRETNDECGAATSGRNHADLFEYSATLAPNGSKSEKKQNASSSHRTPHFPLPTPQHSSFLPDEDGILPVLDGEWFEDHVVARTREFLRVTFGRETEIENLRFIEESLGTDLRSYFVKEFYKVHIGGDRGCGYKKRPIYWMFASPKGGFQALVYLHRYNRDTVNTLLNRYLRPYIGKLEARIRALDHEQATATGKGAQTAARKEQDQLRKTLKECQEWERDVLFPLAQQRLEIDLDDGVKVNYPKFGDALAKIPGVS